MKQLSSILLLLLIAITFYSCSSETDEYDAIISKIAELNPPRSILKKYKIKDFSDVSTLEELSDDHFSDRGAGTGDIWAYSTKQNFTVFIETKDKGHAGEYGVVYSKTGEMPEWNHDEWGEFWIIDEKINPHWWKISYRLG